MTTPSPSSTPELPPAAGAVYHLWIRQVRGDGGLRDLLAIAFPMIVSSATELVMMFTDRVFLSRLGPAHMAASSSGGLMAFACTTFFLGLLGYTTALVAQNYGARTTDRCSLVVHQGMLVALMAYPVVCLLIPVGGFLLVHAGHDPAQQVLELQYFRILLWGACIGLLSGPVRGFFTGIGHTWVVMVASGVSMIANIAANYALIFGKWGMPALGIRGAAYGTLLGGVCGLAVLIAVYLRPTYTRVYGTLQALRLDLTSLRLLFRFGTPAGVEFFLNMAAFNFFIQRFHSCGSREAAAITITLQWDMLAFFPMLGLSMGTTSLGGRFMGAQRPAIAERAGYSGLKAALLYSGTMAAVYALFPHRLVALFASGANAAEFVDAVPLATLMLRMAALYIIADAAAITMGGALRGAGDTRWCMAVSIVIHWSMALLAHVLLLRGATPVQVWGGFVLLVMMMGTVYFMRFRNGKWKAIRVLPGEPILAETAGPPAAAVPPDCTPPETLGARE